MNKQIKNNIDYMLYDCEKRFTFRTEETKKTFLIVIEKALKQLFTNKITLAIYRAIEEATIKLINHQEIETFLEDVKKFFEEFATVEKADEINWNIKNIKIA